MGYIYIYTYIYIYIYKIEWWKIEWWNLLQLLWVGADGGGDLTNVQCKPIQNCHNESSLYNEYILIKMGEKECPINEISHI
jgi:hypothetical protein